MTTGPAFNPAIITREFDDVPVCKDCDEEIDALDVDTEEFEETGDLVCMSCAEGRREKRADDWQLGAGA